MRSATIKIAGFKAPQKPTSAPWRTVRAVAGSPGERRWLARRSRSASWWRTATRKHWQQQQLELECQRTLHAGMCSEEENRWTRSRVNTGLGRRLASVRTASVRSAPRSIDSQKFVAFRSTPCSCAQERSKPHNSAPLSDPLFRQRTVPFAALISMCWPSCNSD